MLHTSVRRGRMVVIHLYSLLLPCSSYCVTLVFTTITMLHTSVRRGRDRIVVLIVLHLYSLLLPCFILQSVVAWS